MNFHLTIPKTYLKLTLTGLDALGPRVIGFAFVTSTFRESGASASEQMSWLSCSNVSHSGIQRMYTSYMTQISVYGVVIVMPTVFVLDADSWCRSIYILTTIQSTAYTCCRPVHQIVAGWTQGTFATITECDVSRARDVRSVFMWVSESL